jgi:SAM-dependent methyltransferase
MPHCILCKSFFIKFTDFNGRPNAGCPVCKSAERHRLIGYYLETYVTAKNLTILHLAPDQMLYNILHAAGKEYVCGDINPLDFKHLPCIKLDATDISYADHKFNLIIALHILEHIPNDKKAIKELHRVLAPKGKLIVMVPQNFDSKETDEDHKITDPVVRTKRFGQADHVRLYGLDFAQRLKDGGFHIKAYVPPSRISQAKLMALDSVDVICDQTVMTDNGFSQWDILYECTK